MIKRTIDISQASYLHLKSRQLLIDQQGDTVGAVPVEDLGILILQHPATTITQGALLACQKNGVAVVLCDERHLPYSTLLPIAEGHHLHNKVLQQQISITRPTRKRLWKEIVQEKIRQQALTLERFDRNSIPLQRLVKRVKSGDPDNCEAEAAQWYWRTLMGESFVRNRDANDNNLLLNYGYSILRALIARALVGTGLHPALGLFHHNQYDGLALADDLMEPLRPWVDTIVIQLNQHNREITLDQSSKQALLSLLEQPVLLEGKETPLLVVSHLLAARLKQCYSNPKLRINWPQWIG